MEYSSPMYTPSNDWTYDKHAYQNTWEWYGWQHRGWNFAKFETYHRTWKYIHSNDLNYMYDILNVSIKA
jgi:hypothetical protein